MREIEPKSIPDYPAAVTLHRDGLYFAWTRSCGRVSRTAGYPTERQALDEVTSILYEVTEYGIIPAILAEQLRAAGAPLPSDCSHAQAREELEGLRRRAEMEETDGR